MEQCSGDAREFASRLHRIEDTRLRMEFRDRFEQLCQQHAGYRGPGYNHQAEIKAYRLIAGQLASRGY